MAFSKVILPTLALAGAVLAQTRDVCDGPSITISTAADAATLADCSTYDGDIIIDPEAAGEIALNGVKQVTGDLTCNNATQLTSLTSDQLGTIGGTFSLTDLTILSNVQFSSLTRVNIINWVGLPALQSLNFAQGISESNSVYISNTQLNDINGIELTAVGTLDINNNPYLKTVDVNNLANVTKALSFSANGRDLEISFPNLEDAANLTFRDVSSVTLPSLALVGGSIGFYSDSFEKFAAPNLTSTGGTLAFVDCPKLTSLKFPSLTQIGGGFLIANNTALEVIDGFGKLGTVVGAIDFSGEFSSVTLTSIADVRGGSNVQTTSTNGTICDYFSAASDAGVIKGVNKCITGTENPQSANPTGTSTSTGSSSSSTSGNSAGSFQPSAQLTGLSALIAALFFI